MVLNNIFFDKDVYEKIKSLESEPRIIENFLSSEEINFSFII